MKQASPYNISHVLDSISNDISLELFKIIANENNNETKMDTKLYIAAEKNKITRKQYYSRISKMMKYGLIKRTKGKYSLTSFGNVLYYKLKTIEYAYENLWKLKAIDSLNNIPEGDRYKIIESLSLDDEIKDIIVSNSKSSLNKNNDKTSIKVKN